MQTSLADFCDELSGTQLVVHVQSYLYFSVTVVALHLPSHVQTTLAFSAARPLHVPFDVSSAHKLDGLSSSSHLASFNVHVDALVVVLPYPEPEPLPLGAGALVDDVAGAGLAEDHELEPVPSPIADC